MAQYFFINKGAELPKLRVELIDDGRNDYRKFFLAIQAADSVTFTMTNAETGIKKLQKQKQKLFMMKIVDVKKDIFYNIPGKKEILMRVAHLSAIFI